MDRMNLIKLAAYVVAGIAFLGLITFPLVTIGILSIWVICGIANYLFCFRRGRKDWRAVDTVHLLIFGIAGPCSFLMNRSKDPRL